MGDVNDSNIQRLSADIVIDGATAQDFVTEVHQVIDRYASFLSNIEMLGALELVKLDRYRLEVRRDDSLGDDAS